MDNMDMGDMNMSQGMGMNMVFTTSTHTTLFSNAWTPHSSAAYAGTCIFLAVLAIISRMLQSYRHLLEIKFHDEAVKRRYIVLNGETAEQREKQTRVGETEVSAEATLTTQGVDERVRVLRTSRRGAETQPWRFSTDLPRACLFTVQAGIGYLLMLAVMTLNVGYFLSVLLGFFVGELALGRFANLDDGHH